jgi:hypothetical protein
LGEVVTEATNNMAIPSAMLRRELPADTAEMVKKKGFKIIDNDCLATYRGPITVDIVWPLESDLEVCLTFINGDVLYATLSGTLPARKDINK